MPKRPLGNQPLPVQYTTLPRPQPRNGRGFVNRQYASQFDNCPKCGKPKKVPSKLCWECRYARPVVVQPEDRSIRLIPLTQNQITTVNTGDYDRMMRRRWCAMWSEDTKSYYAVCRVKLPNGKKRLILMHREILNAKENEIVDHIVSGDTLNNRRSNLRIATDSQSQHNKRRQRNNTSGFIGVDFSKSRSLWRARLLHRRREIIVGYFSTAEEAAAARDIKALELRGEFAVLNFQHRRQEYAAIITAL